jgi:hypothetical protein
MPLSLSPLSAVAASYAALVFVNVATIIRSAISGLLQFWPRRVSWAPQHVVDGLRDNDEFSSLFAFCIKGFLDKEQVTYPTYFGFSSSAFARSLS